MSSAVTEESNAVPVAESKQAGGKIDAPKSTIVFALQADFVSVLQQRWKLINKPRATPNPSPDRTASKRNAVVARQRSCSPNTRTARRLGHQEGSRGS